MGHVFNIAYVSLYMHTMHACTCKIDVIEVLRQSAYVHTRCVCDNLHELACLSGTYTPNVVCMHLNIYINCQSRMIV